MINLTAGMGGDLVLGTPESPLRFETVRSDMASAADRVAHIRECQPEIATLDCGTINFSGAVYAEARSVRAH